MEHATNKIAILGAGITGLTLAWKLKEQNIPFTLFEEKERPGGNMWTWQFGPYMIENGPNTLQINDEVHAFLQETGLAPHIQPSLASAKNRYVLKNGAYRKLPSGPMSMLFTSLLNWGDKRSIFREKKVPAGSDPSESLDAFIRRRFSDGIADYLAAPFVSGIYAGDTRRLKVETAFPKLREWEQEHGSVLRGFFLSRKQQNHKGIISFKEGLGQIPAHLARDLGGSLQLNSQVSRLQQQGDHWEVVVNGESQHFNRVVSTLPAYVLAEILQGEQEWTEKMRAIRYPALAVVATAYSRSDVGHPLQGFGALHNHEEASHTLGTIFSSSVFPKRCPEDEVLLITFVGGDRYPQKALQGEEKIQNWVLEDHQRLLKVKGKPRFQKVFLWERSIPQYDEILADSQSILSQTEDKGLYLGGNWVAGISVPNCIHHGLHLCEQLGNF